MTVSIILKKLNITLMNISNTLRNDFIKNNHAFENKIPLLRIPYTNYDNIEDIITNFIKNNNLNCQENHQLIK